MTGGSGIKRWKETGLVLTATKSEAPARVERARVTCVDRDHEVSLFSFWQVMVAPTRVLVPVIDFDATPPELSASRSVSG